MQKVLVEISKEKYWGEFIKVLRYKRHCLSPNTVDRTKKLSKIRTDTQQMIVDAAKIYLPLKKTRPNLAVKDYAALVFPPDEVEELPEWYLGIVETHPVLT